MEPLPVRNHSRAEIFEHYQKLSFHFYDNQKVGQLLSRITNGAQFLNSEGKTLEEIKLTPENLVEMIAIIEDGTISSKIAKKVFVHLAKNGGGAREYVEKAGLVQISDPEVLIPIIHQVFADNEAAVADFKSGKRNADKAFTGFLMKATKGQANPQVALKLLAQELAKLKEE